MSLQDKIRNDPSITPEDAIKLIVKERGECCGFSVYQSAGEPVSYHASIGGHNGPWVTTDCMSAILAALSLREETVDSDEFFAFSARMRNLIQDAEKAVRRKMGQMK